MTRLLCFSLFVFCFPLSSQAQVFWNESFTGLTDGATSDIGATAWTTTQPSTGTFAKGTILGNEVFVIDNTTTEGVWRSDIIDISTRGDVAIEVRLGANFTSTADYVRAYYILNGGTTEVLFGAVIGSAGLVVSTASSTVVSGTQVQIVIRGMDNTPGITSTIPNAVGFDDVTLTQVSTLYSIANSNWDDGNTWSTGGFGGTACGCTPDDNKRVIIGNNKTVNFNVAGLVSGLDIQTTGRLQWTTATISLDMRRGGSITIANGASLSANGNAGTSIIFNSYAYSSTVNGTLDIGTLDFNTGATFTVDGSGVLTAATITAGQGSTRFITNNITGAGASFTVTGDILFESATSTNSVLNNNGTMTAGRILFDDDNVSVINNATLVLTSNIAVNSSDDDNNKITNSSGATFSFVGISSPGGNLLIDNNGTINQSGNFISFDAGSLFKNLATGVWNWSLTPNAGFDTDVTTGVNLATAGNTFNYNGAGAQSILPVSYQNLTLSVSGSKTRSAAGTIDVNGNLIIQDAAILNMTAPATDMTLAGNWTVLNTASFTESTRTVTFDGSGTQTITNASGETFNNLILNTAATANTVQLQNNITVSSVLTLTRGGLSINGNSATLTNSAAAAIVTGANGYIFSETTSTPYSRLIWNMGATVATYTIPFRDATLTTTSLIFNKTSAGAGAGNFSFATYHTASDNTPYPSTVTQMNRNGADNSANVADRFWIIVPTGYTTIPNATVTFTVTAAEATGITNNTLRAQRWLPATLSWEAPIGGQTNPTAGTQAQVTIPGTSISSIWTLSGNGLPLPIKLAYFRALVEEDQVITSWKTEQEINNDHFTVERATNGEKFAEVGRVLGQGNSHEVHLYSLIDASPYVGVSYYRLKQTDYDGHFTYSEIVMIDYEKPAAALKVFPNPFNGEQVNIELRGLNEGLEVPLIIYNVQGQKVYESTLRATESGVVRELIDFHVGLQSGLYLVKIGNNPGLTQKIVVE